MTEPGWGEATEQLKRRLGAFGLDLTEERIRRLRRYHSELLSWNRRCGLLSRGDSERILEKHIAPSLGPLLLVSPNPTEKWVDVGTGAGLPGLILKLWDPGQPISLIEGSQKKCIFLEHVVRELEIGPLPIHVARAETVVAKGEMIGEFDVLLCRAVANLERTVREFGPLLKVGGRVLTYKGAGWKKDVEEAEKSGVLAPERFYLDEVLHVPWAASHILSIRKVAS